MAFELYLCRHGETKWSLSGQHTGLTDLPLIESGKKQALALGKQLQGLKPQKIFTSPLKRAVETCELAGFGSKMILEPNAVEWDYGSYEGMTSAEIAKKSPGWNLFKDEVPQGESSTQIGQRADLFLQKIAKETGVVLLFSHGHFLRVLAARWLGLEAKQGKLFSLSVGSLSILGEEHGLHVIKMWNA